MKKSAPWLERFFFPPVPDTWLTILRLGLGLQILLFCYSARADWRLLFSETDRSMTGRAFSELFLSTESALAPRMSWLIEAGQFLHLNEDTTIRLGALLLLLAALGMIAGLCTRSCCLVAWFLHLSAVKSAGLTTYGMDNLTTIGLFYLLIAPLPDRAALDARWRRRPLKEETRHGFHRRILQLHLCIIYAFGGFTKALGPEWWNGESIWRALTRPPFKSVPPELLALHPALVIVPGLLVLLLECGYPIFIWLRRTRFVWLGATLLMHLGIALTMGLYLFALIMITLNLAAFGADYLTRGRHVRAAFSRPQTNLDPHRA